MYVYVASVIDFKNKHTNRKQSDQYQAIEFERSRDKQIYGNRIQNQKEQMCGEKTKGKVS